MIVGRDELLSCCANSFTIWAHSNLDLNQKYLLGVFLMQLGEFHTNLGTLIDEILQLGEFMKCWVVFFHCGMNTAVVVYVWT